MLKSFKNSSNEKFSNIHLPMMIESRGLIWMFQSINPITPIEILPRFSKGFWNKRYYEITFLGKEI